MRADQHTEHAQLLKNTIQLPSQTGHSGGPALTRIAGSEAWRSMRGCRRPPLLLVVLEGVVPLLLLPLHSPGKPTAAPNWSTAPAADTPASNSIGETRPDKESVLSSGPLPLLCPPPAGAQNPAAGNSGIATPAAVGCAGWCWSPDTTWCCSVA